MLMLCSALRVCTLVLLSRILSVTSEDKVPSRLKLLHEGVLSEKICSSAALEWGILSTTSATQKSKPKAKCV